MIFVKTIAPEQQCKDPTSQTKQKIPNTKITKIHTGTVFMLHIKDTFRFHTAQYISPNIN